MLVGADATRLREVAQQFDDGAEALRNAAEQVSSGLDGATWIGVDAEEFSSEWHSGGYSRLMAAATALADAARALRRNADEQERASAADGSATASSGNPAGALASAHAAGAQYPPEVSGGGEYPGHGWTAEDKPDLKPYELSGELSDEDFERLTKLLKEAGSPGVLDGNSNEIKELIRRLGKLSDAELSDFLARTDPKLLAKLADGMRDHSFSFQGNGTDVWGRSRLTSILLEKADPSLRRKIFDAFDWAQPNSTAIGRDENGKPFVRTVPDRWATPGGGVSNDSSSWADVRQGDYGDCWALSATAAVAQADPGYIANHFRDNGDGTVSVKLHDKHSDPHWVTVTDDLPMSAGGVSVGAKTGPGGSWPAYVEKAMASVYSDDNDGLPHGSYAALESDRTAAAASYLTGHKADYVSFDKAIKAAERGEPVVVLSPKDEPSGAPDNYHTSHVFFVKGIDGDGNVILGNPWNAGNDDLNVTVSPAELKRCFANAAVLEVP